MLPLLKTKPNFKMKKGDIVKIKVLSKDKKSEEIERKILAVSASGTTVQVQDTDGKMKWKPVTSIVETIGEDPEPEKPLAEKAKDVIQQAEELEVKAKKVVEKKPKPANLKSEIIKLMKEGKTNKEICELLPGATAGYVGPIRTAYFQWQEPNEGTVKKKIIDLHRAGKTVEEIVKETGSSEGHVKFQVNTYKRFHDTPNAQ